MKILLNCAVVPLTLAAIVGCAKNSAPSGNAIKANLSAGIVNGVVVQDNDPVLKSTVGLAMKLADGMATCTATLLSDKIVLTAAHCVDKEVTRAVVLFDKTFETITKDEVRGAVTWAQHPLWEKSDPSGRGDLALVLFKGGIPAGYGAAEMVDDSVRIQPGDDVLVTGYGVDDPAKHGGSGILRKTNVKVVGLLSPTEILTDGKTTSVCFGDSGGPAYVERNGKLLLWGVASAVTNDLCTDYSIHTEISSYADWIKNTMATLNAVVIPPPQPAPSTPVATAPDAPAAPATTAPAVTPAPPATPSPAKQAPTAA